MTLLYKLRKSAAWSEP